MRLLKRIYKLDKQLSSDLLVTSRTTTATTTINNIRILNIMTKMAHTGIIIACIMIIITQRTTIDSPDQSIISLPKSPTPPSQALATIVASKAIKSTTSARHC